MEIRLKKVRDRKRLKMGLPVIDDEDEAEHKEMETSSKYCPEKEDSVENTLMNSLRQLREEQEAKKAQNVREWDLGKEGVSDQTYSKRGYQYEKDVSFGKGPVEKPLLSQEEWVGSKRLERPKNFAPPAAYNTRERFEKYPKERQEKSNAEKASNPFKPHNKFENGLPQWNPDQPEILVPPNLATTGNYPHSTIGSAHGAPQNFADSNVNSSSRRPFLPSSGIQQSHTNYQKSRPTQSHKSNTIHMQKECSSAIGQSYDNGDNSESNSSDEKSANLSLNSRVALHNEMMRNYGGTANIKKDDPKSFE